MRLKLAATLVIGWFALQPAAAQAANEALLVCTFARTDPDGEAPTFADFALHAEDFGKEKRATMFDVVDPSNLLNGASLTAFLKNPDATDEYAFLNAQGSSPRVLLELKRTEKAAVWKAEIVVFSSAARTYPGQCVASGENPRVTFDYWKRNPDKIGEPAT